MDKNNEKSPQRVEAEVHLRAAGNLEKAVAKELKQEDKDMSEILKEAKDEDTR